MKTIAMLLLSTVCAAAQNNGGSGCCGSVVYYTSSGGGADSRDLVVRPKTGDLILFRQVVDCDKIRGELLKSPDVADARCFK